MCVTGVNPAFKIINEFQDAFLWNNEVHFFLGAPWGPGTATMT